MDAYICPKGHASTEPDYCSECGAKITASAGGSAGASVAAAAGAGEVCPDCGTVREQSGIAFCEVCGYNFNTGAHGELGMIPPPTPAPVVQTAPIALAAPEPDPPPAAAPDATASTRWSLTLSVDASLREDGSPEAPADLAPVTIPLDKQVNLVGRRSEVRAVFPEIPVMHDDAVSHRHALLSIDAAGTLLLRDIGSSNGTRLNGTEVPPMTDHPLKDGDAITLGHWSRITVQAS